jgi:hypothetical protein
MLQTEETDRRIDERTLRVEHWLAECGVAED